MFIMKKKYLIIITLLVVAIIGFVIYNQIPDMKPIYNIKKLDTANNQCAGILKI